MLASDSKCCGVPGCSCRKMVRKIQPSLTAPAFFLNSPFHVSFVSFLYYPREPGTRCLVSFCIRLGLWIFLSLFALFDCQPRQGDLCCSFSCYFIRKWKQRPVACNYVIRGISFLTWLQERFSCLYIGSSFTVCSYRCACNRAHKCCIWAPVNPERGGGGGGKSVLPQEKLAIRSWAQVVSRGSHLCQQVQHPSWGKGPSGFPKQREIQFRGT